MNNVVESMLNQFREEHDLGKLKQPALFEAFAAYCIIGNLYPHEFDPDQARVGAKADLGVDAAAIFINGRLYTDPEEVRLVLAANHLVNVHFVVVQAKTEATFDPVVFTQIATNLSHLFISDQIDFPANPKIHDFHKCIRAVYSDIGKLADQRPQLSVWYVAPGTVREDTLAARQQSAIATMLATNLLGSVGFHAAGTAELTELYERSAKSATAEFTMAHRLKMPAMPGVKEAHAGLLPAKVLVEELLRDPLGHIRTSIFDENVRDFLGYGLPTRDGQSRSVNGGIRQTLLDAEARARFAVMNNGITIVTRRMTTVGNRFKLTDFQIVNGCQTSYVLFDRHRAGDLGDDVFVNVRLIESDDDNTISAIVEATNRQTSIAPDGLAARERFHKDLERFFPAHTAGRQLYYERRVGQYDQQQGIEKTRVITHAQLTKAYAAMFLDEAARVGRLRELQDSRGRDLYQPGHDLWAYYASAAVYYQLLWLLRNERIDSTYSPVKWHMIAAARLLILGPEPLPIGPKAANKKFTAIADAVWDRPNAETVFNRMISPIHAAIAGLGADAAALSGLARTMQFAAAFRSEVLKLLPPARLRGLHAVQT